MKFFLFFIFILFHFFFPSKIFSGTKGNAKGGGGKVGGFIYFFNSRKEGMLRRKRQARKSDVGCSQTSIKRACII